VGVALGEVRLVRVCWLVDMLKDALASGGGSLGRRATGLSNQAPACEGRKRPGSCLVVVRARSLRFPIGSCESERYSRAIYCRFDLPVMVTVLQFATSGRLSSSRRLAWRGTSNESGALTAGWNRKFGPAARARTMPPCGKAKNGKTAALRERLAAISSGAAS